MKKSFKHRKFHLSLLILSIFLIGAVGAQAKDERHDPPFEFRHDEDELHDRPFEFLFGNHIDTHQETKLRVKRGKPASLFGFFYIIFTGAIDPASGLPVARHPQGAPDEECGVDVDCVAGWIMHGKPGAAKFLYHSGVNGNDHPVWLVNRVQIPQPGSYTHFHWITLTSTDPRAYPETVPAACDKNNAGQLETVSPSAVNQTCPGWFLQIRAIRKFAFQHGGEVIPVRPGIDNKSHLNLVTNYAEVSGITRTRRE